MNKELIKQFFLLVGLNIGRMVYYWHLLLVAIVIIGIIVGIGFYITACAIALFLFCGLFRPSIVQKNINYGIWTTRFLPVCIMNIIILWGVQSSLLLTAVCIPVIIFTALYVFDSGLRVRRLINLPVSISKIVWHSKYITAVIALIIVASITYLPLFVTLFGTMPLFVLMCIIVYYQTIYKQFGVYYAAD